MADSYIVLSKPLEVHHATEADALGAAKNIAVDPHNQVTHVYVYRLIAEVNGEDPQQLNVQHYGH